MPFEPEISTPSVAQWRPPSRQLNVSEGIWHAETAGPVSYPSDGNDTCYQVEDQSYWFAHRAECIQSAMTRLAPHGMIYDIGGGNGQVAHALQTRGLPVALLEPGPGAFNAKDRGVKHVIHATLEGAGLQEGSLPAAGAFDVLEHIENSAAFLSTLHRLLVPQGRFYCTVPAFPSLWSQDDLHAGHFRRYTEKTLQAALQAGGFDVLYCSYFFSWLVGPLWLRRSLPWRLRRRTTARTVSEIRRDHSLPACLAKGIGLIHAWESRQIAAGKHIVCGTSLLCVAEARRS